MIKLICVGNLKESYLKVGCYEYQKRINAFTKFEIIELKESATSKEGINLEGKKILEKISDKDYVIGLFIQGKTYDSVSFANHLNEVLAHARGNVVFVIGASWGLSDEVKARCDEMLSFSSFTFPHQLMRLIFLEQLYRAFTILNHKEYHK